jgi:hypothetical protein
MTDDEEPILPVGRRSETFHMPGKHNQKIMRRVVAVALATPLQRRKSLLSRASNRHQA